MKRIMLANPNYGWFNTRAWTFIPYSLALLRSVIPNGYKVNILEPNLENLTFDQVRKRIDNFFPDILAISCPSLEYSRNAHKLAEIAKSVSRSITVVLGGVYATTTPYLAMRDKNIDYLIMGEGERRFPQF